MRKKNIGRKVMWILKTLLASYIITGVLLLLLTFLVYKFQLDEQIVIGAIVVIYVISTFCGGFIIGKLMGVKKYLWGMAIGVLYVFLLFAISYGVYREFNTNGLHMLTTIALCVGGGILGGMIS
jgi:putative membrane protein (TIGR04086 family)